MQLPHSNHLSKITVVRNPWEKIAHDMADLEEEDYKRLLCVETTHTADDVREIAPGGECQLVANYRVVQG